MKKFIMAVAAIIATVFTSCSEKETTEAFNEAEKNMPTENVVMTKEIDAAGGTFTFEVQCAEKAWFVSSDSWIFVSNQVGSANAYGTRTYMVTYMVRPTDFSRIGYITYKQGNITNKIKIMQAGKW